jgi:hypothetical protein
VRPRPRPTAPHATVPCPTMTSSQGAPPGLDDSNVSPARRGP